MVKCPIDGERLEMTAKGVKCKEAVLFYKGREKDREVLSNQLFVCVCFGWIGRQRL